MTAESGHHDGPSPIALLQAGIEAIVAELAGTMGVTVLFLEDGHEVRVNGDTTFPSASVIKVPIMVEAYRQAEEGALSLDDTVRVSADSIESGSGVLQFLHVGLELTLRDAVELMVVLSDNTATNLVTDAVGCENVNRTMAALGLRRTELVDRRMRGKERRSQTTPDDTAALLAGIARGEIVSRRASEAMMTTLGHQLYDDGLPRSLPVIAEPERFGLRALPVAVAHKTGSLSGVRHDAGVLLCETAAGRRTVAVSAFTRDLEDGELWTPENIGLRAIAAVTRLAYETQLALVGEVPFEPRGRSVHKERSAAHP